MRIEYNGHVIETEAHNLSALLDERDINPGSVAVAVDGVFVPRSAYDSFDLNDGAALEVLTATQGG